MSELMLAFHPRESFDDRVHELLREFRQEWERYWGIRGDEPPRDGSLSDELEIRGLYETADRLVRAAVTLSPARLPDDKRNMPDWLVRDAELERQRFQEYLDTLRAQLPDEPLSDPNFWGRVETIVRETASPAQQRELFFRTAVELLVFERFASGPATMASRALELLAFLVATRSGRAREYLTRVSRCFILDLRPELAIMCRAVLDAALEDQDLDSSVIARILRAQNGNSATLSVRIEAARQVGTLDVDGYIAALAVRDGGNDAVHNVPGSAPDASTVLRNLKVVLEQLTDRK